MGELSKQAKSLWQWVDVPGTSSWLVAAVLRAQTLSRSSAATAAAAEGVPASLAAHLIAAVQAKSKATAVVAKAVVVAPAEVAPNPLAERIREAQQVVHINSQELSSAGDTPHQTHNAAAGVSSVQAAFFSHARPAATPATAAQPKPPESDNGLHQ